MGTDPPTPRIRLCPTTTEHLGYVLALEADPANAPYVMAWTYKQHAEAIQEPSVAHLMLIDTADDPVGYVILAGLQDEHRGIEFKRIVVAAKERGIGSAAVALVKELAFEQRSAHRLWLDVVDHNRRARHVYQRAGFSEEGVLRDSVSIDGEHLSLVVMSILRSEYEEREGSRPVADRPS